MNSRAPSAGQWNGSAAEMLLHPCQRTCCDSSSLLRQTQQKSDPSFLDSAPSCDVPPARRHRRDLPCVNTLINILGFKNPVSVSL